MSFSAIKVICDRTQHWDELRCHISGNKSTRQK